MAETTITALPSAVSVDPADVLASDNSAGTLTQKITVQQAVNEGLKAPGTIGGTTPGVGNFSSVDINGGTIDGASIGASSASSGAFTTLSASSTVSGTGFSTYLASPPAIGGGTPAAGNFTTLSASSTVSGTGFSTYLASPPAIGGGTPAAGNFTTLGATGNVTLGDASADTVTVNSGTVTFNNSTTVSAASAKTLTLNGGGGSNGVVLDASNNVLIGTASATASAAKLQTVDGITFPATQAAAANANTLDDYEEGSWVPSVGGDATYVLNVGTYVKIGRAVYIQARINISTIGTGSTTVISGLPFTAVNTYDRGIISVGETAAVATALYSLCFQIASNTTTMSALARSAAGSPTVPAIFQNNTNVLLSGVYFAAV